ncbi:aminodeoxychorismate lyase [Solemya pervernicosa gill symbiont]|uniref:Aminodeoxychorismate lyase n=2 Tax=Gammaproteobacteria incertae sedis TaxID=118884 RepID=A0A1T2L246_9GAMM|nr:aminodeoxychorismate lyase [Candidatus Reidiella endopervernicosa]OOZ39016.1 aminodeoxychorismate lyase [Solemya pervernicosa gill symbiont]QKQ26905.1 aminodeoxychorismate lyase [Candidatus Reidiella endopervernicosa]
MILVNGKRGMTVDLLDRGFQYGDGLFETVAFSGGELAHWDRHMHRLEQGCLRLGIPTPDLELLRKEAQQLIKGEERAVIKLIITRGSGGRGYRPPIEAKPTRIVARYGWPAYPDEFAEQGIWLRLCETPVSINPRLAGLKHLNRLDQVLARGEWDDDQVPEGLMLDADGWVVEGTQSNLFIIKEGRLVTPDLSRCGVAGIMREVVIEAAAMAGIECEIGALSLESVKAADALFVCNSLIGIWPVRQLGKQLFKIDAITRTLQQAVGHT